MGIVSYADDPKVELMKKNVQSPGLSLNLLEQKIGGGILLPISVMTLYFKGLQKLLKK